MPTSATAPETRRFEAEVAQVLHLVTHSLYSNKQVFLRELVSNASDACDRLRFLAIAEPALAGAAADLHIDLDWDTDARTVTVRDTGVGMDREELVQNLGTIARSGTRRFIEALGEAEKAEAALIGQFGVGFYSAFVVADHVSVVSRRAGQEQAWQWRSDGVGEYTIEAAELDGHGTAVTVHLKEGEDEFLEAWRLRELLHRYSDHIAFPIRMPRMHEGAPTAEREVVNQASALWARPKSDIADDDYRGFYKHLSHDFGDPLAWTHNRVEGRQSFTCLLYVPERAPLDFLMGRDERQGLRLYVRRVFIMDAAEQMLPAYLRFVRGVVDSDDLPLNVSRELLQENRQVERIRGALVKRVLDLLERIAGEDAERYGKFWEAFGNVLKEGIAEDPDNRERIAGLLRFPSTVTGSERDRIGLSDYVARMQPGADAIWYLTAEGWNVARNSPHLEALKARGVEVLLLHERVDEWMIGHLNSFAGKPLRNVAKGEFDAGQAQAGEAGTADGAGAEAATRLRDLLGERVRDVRVSRRLTESPSCLVLEEHDMALHMQRLLKAAGHPVPESRPVLEINPAHPLVVRAAATEDLEQAGELAQLLLDQARIASGESPEDPAAFLRRVNALIAGT